MNIGTWNVMAINGKDVELVGEAKKYKIEILGVTETKKKGQGVQNLGSHKLIYSGVNIKERAKAGVALLLTNNIYETSDYNFVSERLLEVNIESKHRNIKIIVAYGPNEDASKEDREEFYNQLQLIIDNATPKQEILILGDLNARVGNSKDRYFGAVGKEGESRISPNGELLLDLCIRNNLKIANTFFKHKDIHKWTRVSEERGEKSIIDYIIVSSHLFYNTNDVRVKRGAEIGSDHFLVIGKFNLSIKYKTRTEPKKFKINIKDLKNKEAKEAYQKLIDKKLKKLMPATKEDTESLWSVYKKVITDSANKICNWKVIGGQNKRTAWWNNVVKQKVKEKKDAWKQYLASKDINDLNIYRTKRKEAKDEVIKSKQQQWEQFGEKLEENFRENQKLFWGAIKRCRRGNQNSTKYVKNKQGDIVKDKDKILEVWKDYFQSLHNMDNNEGNVSEENNSVRTVEKPIVFDNYDDDNIKIKELISAKKKIKVGKAPGSDGIFPEMVVNQSSEADKLLLKICQLAFKTKTVPNDWNNSMIIPIYKNGSTTQCENYRGISLLSVPGKVYARILETRLRDKVEAKLDQYQSGFRPGRSVHDHIFTLRQISESTYQYNKKTHACFIDLQKAFDLVKRKEIWKALEEHDVNENLIKAIQSFYNNPESMVRIGGETSTRFNINVGVRQGCILSPLLFIIFMNSISNQCVGMRSLNVGMWRLKPVKLKMLAFADDLVVFGKTQRDLQVNVNILNTELKKRGLKINAKKTKSMVISRDSCKHEIKINEEILEQVDSFKYLGVIISSNCSLKEEINQRISKATNVYSQLGNGFIGKRELTKRTKISIFNSVYCPTLIYGSETWNLDNRDKSRLQAAEMKFLRRSIGKTRKDRIRNTRIREELKTESLVNKIEKNQLRWFGHVNRMEEDRIPKQILECKQQGTLPVGRPRTLWQKTISEMVKKRGSTFVKAKRKTLNRDQWRKFVQCS